MLSYELHEFCKLPGIPNTLSASSIHHKACTWTGCSSSSVQQPSRVLVELQRDGNSTITVDKHYI
jgi:hypothetical protein